MMKSVLAFLLIAMTALSGCAPLISGGSSEEMPTPVVDFVTPQAPTDQPTAAPTDAPTTEPEPQSDRLLAYVAADGNVRIKTLPSGDETAVTSDATGEMVVDGVGMIRYSQLTWSSDGLLLAFLRDEGKQISEGLDYSFFLQVHDVQSGQVKTLLEDIMLAGFAWQPGTHRIAYALSTEPGYFVTRGGVDAALAKGIWTVDTDSGETAELVKPERGLHLVNPQWSPSGQVVGFEEVEFMEGRGKWGYFDLGEGAYHALDQQLGNYDWMPDGSGVVFDTMVYTASGMERIWKANRDGTGALRISPHYGDGYSFLPVLSPSGDLVAYFSEFGDVNEPSKLQTRLYVQPLEEVEPRELAELEQVYSLAWSPDGSDLIVSQGEYNAQVIVQVHLADGFISELASGSWPALQP